MTGGILGSSFYDPGVKVPDHEQTGYARLPDGASQTLINDTIYLDDPAFILPRRSHVRRRKFQDLQNRCVGRCHKPWSITPGCADMIQILPSNFVRMYKPSMSDANVSQPPEEGIERPISRVHCIECSGFGDLPCLGRSSRERSMSSSTSQPPSCLWLATKPQQYEARTKGQEET